MKFAVSVVLGVLFLHSPASAETGFLDRTVTIGAATYPYQVYVPADHTRARSWPVIVFLHGDGAQGQDGLLPTARGLADAIRFDRPLFPVVAVFPQAEKGKRRVETSDIKPYSDREKAADRQANPFLSAADPFAALALKIKHLPIRIFHGDGA